MFSTKTATLVLLLALGCGDDTSVMDGGVPDGSHDMNSDVGVDVASDVPRDAPRADTTAPDGGGVSTLSERYPGDDGIASDPATLFFDDFESGWGRWDAPRDDTRYLTIREDGQANSGNAHLQSRVSVEDLAETQYISSQARVNFAERSERLYWRFYAHFPNVAPNPHHWVRVSAGDEDFNGSGRANMRPAGDEGFWFDLDLNNDDVFNYYVYWHEMRTNRCNDGTDTPGCDGDQGTANYYGNVFRPAGQEPFERGRWMCIEIEALANDIGVRNGSLTLYVDGDEIGRYAEGEPDGTWLRETFHEGGCDFFACEDPTPFEGFVFRTSEDVGFKGVVLDAYYERNTTSRRLGALRERGLMPSDEQIIWYDDVVVATERIGCRVD